MCGIGVSVDLAGKGRCRPWALSVMQHRGPDGEGTFVDPEGDIVMEHCRLAIIDADNRHADQPFRDPSGRWTMVYNGELFNYRGLRLELEAHGVTFRTRSDTEVVLQAVVHFGVEVVNRFRGMFAFILWDRDRRELIAVRDQIGVKPLYYAVMDEVLVAASELRTVIGHPLVHPRIDPRGVVEFLAFGFVAGEGTLIQNVKKLPPGHLLKLRGGQVNLTEYWDALPIGAHDDAQDSELADSLHARVDSAVHAALVSDVPVSLMLSGGLDSSVIAAIAARHVRPSDLTAYSVSFGRPTDESDAARRLARFLGLRFRKISLTPESLALGFEQWLSRLDVPTANPTSIAVSAIAQAVREDGNKVLLSGDGGDELFGGYNRWMKYLRFHDRWWKRGTPLGRRIFANVARPIARGLAGDICRRARDGGELFVGSRPLHDDDLRRCLGPVGMEAALEFPPETGVEAVRQRFEERLPDGDYLAWMSYLTLKRHLVEDYLLRLDVMGMAESVEGRVPLLDVDLVEFAFSVSRTAKIGSNYEQKALFRRMAASLVPEFILQRPKQGFCPPVADWAAALFPNSVPAESVLVKDGLLHPHAFDVLSQKRSSNAAFGPWALGTLNAWCDANLR